MIRRLTDDSKSWFITWYQEWDQLLGGCNWYDFTICHIAFENDKIMGGVEVTFVILGIGFRWRWNHTRTEAMQDIIDQVEDIKAGTAKTKPWREVMDEIKSEEKGSP